VYTDSALNSADADAFAGDMVPGAPLDDAPVEVDGQPSWLLDRLGGRFQLLLYVERAADFDGRLPEALAASIPVECVLVTAAPGGRPGVRALHDVRGRFLERYDALPGSAWLVRPDQHVAARWRRAEPQAVRAALARATGNLHRRIPPCRCNSNRTSPSRAGATSATSLPATTSTSC
jgi:3-(3-hydroxy-phenyl)propionate hydroxylase